MFGKKAAVQYDDWKGTVTLDKDDLNDISDWAVNEKITNDNERVFGFEIQYSKIANTFSITLNTTKFSFDEIKNSQQPNDLISNKNISLTPEQFIELLTNRFKRINIIACSKALD
ncbi:hypothetical protein I9723_003344 [Morganella morganii]|nr:hypothetical protein [Morganella morganii]